MSCCALALVVGAAMLGGGGTAMAAQTLARPGWAGSGMTSAQWWRNAVLFQVFADDASAGNGASADHGASTLLGSVAGELDDLQVLGVDALLLRGVDAGATAADAKEGRLSRRFGTPEQFDELLAQASRRRMRVLVEIPGSLSGDALTNAARFWLGRGVSGLFLGQDPGGAPAGAEEAKLVQLRGVLHSYLGERVLVADSGDGHGGAELVLRTIRGFAAGQPADVAQIRHSETEARASGEDRGGEPVSVAQIDPAAGEAAGDAARARLSVLLMVPGGVAVRAGETGQGPAAQALAAKQAQEAKDKQALAAATSPAAVSNVQRAIARRAGTEPPQFAGDSTFAWAERMVGLHRGSPAMLRGQQTLLDFDAQGAVVSVWRGASGPVLCEVVNLRPQAVELSLKQGFAGMDLRGVFLRPVARTDSGMGAMPLEHVKVPGYGVFVGELGR